MKLATIVILAIVFNEIRATREAADYLVPRNCTEIYTEPVPRYVPYRETYRTRNWLGFPNVQTRINYRFETYVNHHKRSICCPGYNEYNSTLCEPHCSRDCGINAVCAEPAVCECNDGYKLDSSFNECKPICIEECENGDCTYPNVCVCHAGYRKLPGGHKCEPICNGCLVLEYCVEPHICKCINGYTRASIERIDSDEMIACKPICDVACVNADCVAPNVCRCHDSYANVDGDEFTCEPKCSMKCQNGICVSPDKCQCFPGYELKNDSWYKCEPVCTNACTNAECIAPETCSCLDGYVPVGDESSNTCWPYCSVTCSHGRCAKPEECACDDGYFASNNGTTCLPICTVPCHMGNCTEPDTCTCFEGYELSAVSNTTCEPICDNDCANGRCTAPNECTCDDGYEKMNNTVTNGMTCVVICDCENGYCNETSSTCDACLEGYELTNIGNATVCKPRCEGECANGRCVAPQKCECNDYYLAENDSHGNPICVHACGADGCAHGNCTLEDGACNCSYGWSGAHCDVPIVCALAVVKSPTIDANESFIIGDNVDETLSVEVPWSGPSCNKRCSYEINNATKCVNQSSVICFINIDATCNTYVAVQSSIPSSQINVITTVVSSVLTLLLIGTAITTSLFIRKRKKEKSIELAKSNQQVQKDEEENLIESEGDGVSL